MLPAPRLTETCLPHCNPSTPSEHAPIKQLLKYHSRALRKCAWTRPRLPASAGPVVASVWAYVAINESMYICISSQKRRSTFLLLQMRTAADPHCDIALQLAWGTFRRGLKSAFHMHVWKTARLNANVVLSMTGGFSKPGNPVGTHLTPTPPLYPPDPPLRPKPLPFVICCKASTELLGMLML